MEPIAIPCLVVGGLLCDFDRLSNAQRRPARLSRGTYAGQIHAYLNLHVDAPSADSFAEETTNYQTRDRDWLRGLTQASSQDKIYRN